MRRLILFLALTWTSTAFGQNYVSNHSFEDNTTIPCGPISSSAALDLAATGWIYASRGTSDIHSTTVSTTCWNHATSTSGPGSQAPRTGDEMGGFYGYIAGRTDDYREYLQVKLDSTMEIGQLYCVEMYVSLADNYNGYAIGNIGMLLSVNKVDIPGYGPIPRTPHILETSIVTNDTGWHRITGSFIADSAYDYLVLGSFGDSAALPKMRISTSVTYSYYFFDDIFVVPITDDPVVGQKKDTILCAGDTITLEAGLDSANLNYVWNTGNRTHQIFVDTPGIYWVEISQCGFFRTDSFIVSAAPNPAVDLGNDTIICNETILNLDAENPGATYEWNTTETTQTITAGSSGWYKVSVTNALGCVDEDSIYVERRPIFNGDVTDDAQICIGDSIQLLASGGVTYSWRPDASLSGLTISNPYASPSSTSTYIVTIDDGICAPDDDTVTIAVNPLPTIDLLESYKVFIGETYTISTAGGTSYHWWPDEEINCTNCQYPTVTPTTSRWYYVRVIDGNGCESIDSIFIEVIFDGFIGTPTAFSPNDDGINDVYHLLPRGAVDLIEFSVYNRWGQRVFTTTNFNEGWTGLENDIGVYVYRMSYALAGQEKPINAVGNITLIR